MTLPLLYLSKCPPRCLLTAAVCDALDLAVGQSERNTRKAGFRRNISEFTDP